MNGDLRPAAADARSDLLAIYRAALGAVNGRNCVRRFLNTRRPAGPVYLAAIGKAAGWMYQGARDALGDRLHDSLVITRHGYLPPGLLPERGLVCLEAGHPLPDADSLAAGAALLRFLAGLPAAAGLLVLLSGGASSLVEVLPDPLDLDTLRRLNTWLLASGLPIRDINRVRNAVSTIKGGRLVEHVGDRPVTVLLISDVPGDDPATIGSGPLYPAPVQSPEDLALPDWIRACLRATRHAPATGQHRGNVTHHVIANLDMALEAACRAARQRGYAATLVERCLTGDAVAAGRQIADTLGNSPDGVYLWGGETTVRLPAAAGEGGRCQSLALAAAGVLAGDAGTTLLAAGTDGSDGTGGAAGAVIDGGTLARGTTRGLDAGQCLRCADAGTFLGASNDLLVTGPTGTNVTDLVIAIRTLQDGRGPGNPVQENS